MFSQRPWISMILFCGCVACVWGCGEWEERRGLLRHILSPLHNLSPATNCIYVGGTFRHLHAQFDAWRQNVQCNSAYFVVPHQMDSNIHRDIYLLTMKEAIYYILCYVYILLVYSLCICTCTNMCGFNNVVSNFCKKISIGWSIFRTNFRY